MKIRKQVYNLTPKDLKEFPVWEFALDEEGEEGQDEATVRPVSRQLPVDPSYGMQIVLAAFVLADGTKTLGYLTPPTHPKEDLGTIQPVIVVDRGQVPFWYGVVAPTRKRMGDLYELLERTAKSIFPLKFESVVPLVGGPVTGQVKGFVVLEDWKSGKTRTIK